jgi:hypothetical protein
LPGAVPRPNGTAGGYRGRLAAAPVACGVPV